MDVSNLSNSMPEPDRRIARLTELSFQFNALRQEMLGVQRGTPLSKNKYWSHRHHFIQRYQPWLRN